ncbi:MAG: hypothetical protein AAF847_08730 [Bacteroidota bacterium]
MSEDALKHTIKQLPQYRPSLGLWDKIEGDLELEKAVQQLPTYRPSAAVWDKIEAQLPARRVPMRVRTWLKVAAGLAILLLATFWWQTQQNQATILVENSTEQHQPALLTADWDEDEDAFVKVQALCQQHPFLCENDNFQNLQAELGELEEAKNMVLASMQQYGNQARLVHQVKAIEQERSDVLKEMVEMI